MNDLTISIDGGPPIPLENVVVFQNGRPIAVVHQRGEATIYMDAAREPREVAAYVRSLGFCRMPEHRLVGRLVGETDF